MPTGISYVDETWNPVRGCTLVSPGCANCYAKSIAHRFRWGLTRSSFDGFGNPTVEWTGEVRLVPEALEKPLRWRKPRRVLVPSMGDLFHEDVPDEYIAAVFGVMAATQQHTHLLLTKRIERVPKWLEWLTVEAPTAPRGSCLWHADAAIDGRRFHRAQHTDQWPLPNVLIGCTVEDQRRADERLPVLAEIAAMGWRTWVSVEPMLEKVDMFAWLDVPGAYFGRPAWPPPEFVAVGAETGQRARPRDQTWVWSWIASVVDQCAEAGVRCHVKQLYSRGGAPGDGWPRGLVRLRRAEVGRQREATP